MLGKVFQLNFLYIPSFNYKMVRINYKGCALLPGTFLYNDNKRTKSGWELLKKINFWTRMKKINFQIKYFIPFRMKQFDAQDPGINPQ